MRIRLTFLFVWIICAGAPALGGDGDAPLAPVPTSAPVSLDPNSASDLGHVVISGHDSAYAALRTRLAEGEVEQALAVLDAIRGELGASGGPLSSSRDTEWLTSGDVMDAAAKAEGALLEQDLKEKAPWVVRVEAHFLRIDADRGAQLLSQVHLAASGGVRTISDDVAALLLGSPRSDAVARPDAPAMEALAGQTVTLLAVAGVRYLQDYDIEGCNSWTKTPIVGAVEGGMRLRVRATPVPQHEDLVALEVQLQTGSVVSPMQIFTDSSLAALGPLTIQLPEVRIADVSGKPRARAGSWVLACARGFPTDPEVGAALLRVTRVAAPGR